jgi:hypothetical protein
MDNAFGIAIALVLGTLLGIRLLMEGIVWVRSGPTRSSIRRGKELRRLARRAERENERRRMRDKYMGVKDHSRQP